MRKLDTKGLSISKVLKAQVVHVLCKLVESAMLTLYASACTVTIYLLFRMRIIESGFIECHQLGLGSNIEAKH